MTKKFLIPLDGSELSESVLPWARLLADKTNRQVELLRCYEPPASVYLLPELAAPPPTYQDQAFPHKDIQEYLAKQVKRFAKDQAVPMRAEGDPAMAILDRCDSGEIEWVIMASHGRGGLGRWLLGSVATKVVRGSHLPVLVVNAQTEVTSPIQLKRILVCLDGSEVSEAALPQAVELAKQFEARLVLYQGVALTPIGHPKVDAAVAYELQNSKDYLDKVRARYPEIPISVISRAAGPGLGIAEQAEQCDLIVIGSHGRSGVRRWLLGSTAEQVIQAAHRPILIVYQREQP